jgi:hypothetical protein
MKPCWAKEKQKGVLDNVSSRENKYITREMFQQHINYIYELRLPENYVLIFFIIKLGL